jgi:citrate lyase subunit beta / citryl-CoA lyase
VSARSYLYVPGHRPEMMAKAAERGADAVILDLEDAVPPDRKDEARKHVAEFLHARAPGKPAVWVRVNSGDLLAEDVRAIAPGRPDGISLPKVASADDVVALDVLLGDASMPVSVLIETAAAVLDVREIARAPRVARLQIGEADLCGEIGAAPDAPELATVRMQIVLASAAAGLEPPIGPVSTDFTDLDALRESTWALKRMGFGARAAIHPAQVKVINEMFTPSAEEIEKARRLLARFEAGGKGAMTDEDGRMIDEAYVRSARRILSFTDS